MNEGANLTKRHIDIGRACMPLVRLLRQDGLSWSEREEIAWAIQDNLRVYKEHQQEQSAGMVAAAFAGLRSGASS